MCCPRTLMAVAYRVCLARLCNPAHGLPFCGAYAVTQAIYGPRGYAVAQWLCD